MTKILFAQIVGLSFVFFNHTEDCIYNYVVNLMAQYLLEDGKLNQKDKRNNQMKAIIYTNESAKYMYQQLRSKYN